MGDSVLNIGKNAILPVDLRKTQMVFGNAEYVTVEVIVSALVRKILKAPKSWTSLVMIHTLSLPFMGGAQGFVDPITQVDGADFKTLFVDGAKGIPAVLMAQWILDTFNSGFQFPWFNMKDLLITAGAKTISRPITALIYPYLPASAQDAYQMAESMIARQKAASSLSS